jgi:hypothetical protein
MELTYCEKFPSLSPFEVRKKPIREVFKIWNRLIDHAERDMQNRDPKTGERILWRPAGNDWY